MRQQMPTLALTSEIRTRQRGGTNFPFGSSDLVSSPEPCLRACGLSLLPWPHLCPSASLKGLLLPWPRPPRLESSPSLTGPAVAPSQLGVEAPSALHRGPNVFSLKHSSEPLSPPPHSKPHCGSPRAAELDPGVSLAFRAFIGPAGRVQSTPTP